MEETETFKFNRDLNIYRMHRDNYTFEEQRKILKEFREKLNGIDI